MTTQTYKWKPKTNVEIDAQAAGERLEAIRVRNNGRLNSHLIVEDARPADAVLHNAFEWNDEVAAEKYRREQAGYMLRSIVVIIPQDDQHEEDRTIRAFVNITQDGDRSYTSIAHAMSDADLRHQVVETAWRELLEWKKRYEEYNELASVVSVIEAESGRRKAA